MKYKIFLVFIFFLINLNAQQKLRVGVLAYGTVNWGLEILKQNGLDKKNGFDKIEKFKIASNANGNGRYDGSMDNFAVWNRVLSESDIKKIMSDDYQTNNQQILDIFL